MLTRKASTCCFVYPSLPPTGTAANLDANIAAFHGQGPHTNESLLRILRAAVGKGLSQGAEIWHPRQNHDN